MPHGVSRPVGGSTPPAGRLVSFFVVTSPPCLPGFAVAQCINQHSSPSLSSPSPSASGSPSGSGSTSHCDSGGASSSSTPSATQSPSGIGHVTRAGGLRGTLSSLNAETADPQLLLATVLGDAATRGALCPLRQDVARGFRSQQASLPPFAGWATERPSLTAEPEGMDSRWAGPTSTPLSLQSLRCHEEGSPRRACLKPCKRIMSLLVFSSSVTYQFPLSTLGAV